MNNLEVKKSKRVTLYIALLLLFFLFPSVIFFYSLHNKRAKMQVMEFTPLSGPLLNPLMGWAPWATLEMSSQPHTLVYMDLTWKDFEPIEGVYDFHAFEKKQQLDRWRQEGKRVVFRFVMDKPGKDSHIDIPDWLFEKLNRDGEFYDNQYGKGFSPNYSNPTLMGYHRVVLKVLGDKYGKDGFFAFIELGSLGHWGEWHVSSELRQLPPENIRDQYVLDYIDAFPGTHLLMRRPFTSARNLSLGLYNDMTGSVKDTNVWLDWIQNGGNYLPNEKNTLVPMTNSWKKTPVGGEQAPTMNNQDLYATNLDTTLRLLKESHTTFIGPNSPGEVEVGSVLQAGIDEVITTIGYRLHIVRVEMPFIVNTGNDVKIKIQLRNDGIAPFYYNWPSKVYLFNKNNDPVFTFLLDIDLRNILPGNIYDFEVALPINDIQQGTHTVGIAILDPNTGQPSVEFANENDRIDLVQSIGSFDIR